MDDPLPFECGKNCVTVPGLKPGMISLEELCEKTDDMKHDENLKSYGLSQEEICFFKDADKGLGYLKTIHKNIEETVLHQMIKDIRERVERGRRKLEDKSFEKEETFIEPVHNSNAKIFEHPMNNLLTLTEDLFGHMDVDKLPSINKRKKLVRRMERKLNKPILLPEPKLIPKTDSKNLYDNQFSKVQQSMWDIKKIDDSKCVLNKIEKPKTKKIGCISKTLYTIKNNKIVRLEPEQNSAGKYKFSDIILPINKTEEKMLEGTKLSVDEIKKIPRFENYSSGQPSKVLFVKNLSNNINENDLKFLFEEYQDCTNIKLMKGKMRGQAFITFNSLPTATRTLHEKNGTIVKGRPIILEYGKQSDTNINK